MARTVVGPPIACRDGVSYVCVCVVCVCACCMRVVSVSVAVQPSAGKLGGTMRHNGRVNVIRFSADGTRMYSGDSEGGILVWEVDGRDASASTAAFTPFCFIMHPDFEGKNITSMVVQPKQDGRNRLLVMAYNVRWPAARCVVVVPTLHGSRRFVVRRWLCRTCAGC